MAAPNRIYAVHENGKPAALVRARSQAEAIRHCTANRFEAVVADQDMLIKALSDGLTVEDATAAQE